MFLDLVNTKFFVSKNFFCTSQKNGTRFVLEVVLMQFNMYILLLIASFTSTLSCCITSAISCLNCCGNVAKSAGVTMSGRCCYCCCCCCRRCCPCLGVVGVFPFVASLTDALLPCQMQLHFVARLEPKRMRWKSDQMCTAILKARKQMCRSATVSSPRVTQHSSSAWAGFAPMLTVMLTVAEKSCLGSRSVLRRVLTNLLEHGCAIDQHGTDVQILVKVSVALS